LIFLHGIIIIHVFFTYFCAWNELWLGEILMTEYTEVPEPQDSGSDGSQIKADLAHEFIPSQQLTNPMAQAISGLAASNSRAFGGEVASTLIAGATSQMSIELNQTKEELAVLRDKYESLMNSLAEVRIKKAVLSERIVGFNSTRHLKNIGIAIGGILLGLGVKLIGDNAQAYGFGAIIVGALLLIAGWFSTPKEGEK
jgi:hypothetical protein